MELKTSCIQISLLKMSKDDRQQINNKFNQIEKTNCYKAKSLKGKKLKGIYSMRINKYRVLYRLIGKDMDIVKIDNRSKIYKKATLL